MKTFPTQNKSTNQSYKAHESAKGYKHILQKSTQEMNLFKMNLIFRINIRFKTCIIMKLKFTKTIKINRKPIQLDMMEKEIRIKNINNEISIQQKM